MKKIKEKSIFKFLMLYVPIVILILGIGYANVSYDLSASGSIAMSSQDDIAIINMNPATYVENYNKTVLTASLELDNALDTKTMSVTIKNLGNSKQIFDGIVYDPTQSLIYSNSNIVPSISGMTENSTTLNTTGNNDDNITFSLTFSYDDTNNITDNTLDGTINFHFTPLREITYVNCTNSSSLSSEYIRSKSFTNMNNVTYTPTVTIDSSPSNITITDSSSNTLVSGTDYTYSNGVVTFLTEITSDLTITASNGSGGNGGTWATPVEDTTTIAYDPSNVPVGTTLYSGVDGAPKVTKDENGNITDFEFTDVSTSNPLTISSTDTVETGFIPFDGSSDWELTMRYTWTWADNVGSGGTNSVTLSCMDWTNSSLVSGFGIRHYAVKQTSSTTTPKTNLRLITSVNDSSTTKYLYNTNSSGRIYTDPMDLTVHVTKTGSTMQLSMTANGSFNYNPTRDNSTSNGAVTTTNEVVTESWSDNNSTSNVDIRIGGYVSSTGEVTQKADIQVIQFSVHKTN